MTASIDISETRKCHCLAARRNARAITRLFDEKLRPFGLRSTQFSVLAALAIKGETPLGELADVLGLERTTLSRSANLLEEKGWIASAPTTDNRERRLALASEGRERLESALPAWKEAQDQVESAY